MNVVITPRRSSKVRYSYAVPDYQAMNGYVIITQLVVILEDEGEPYTDEGVTYGPLFVDYDAWGYAATSKGNIDKRSKKERKYPSKSDHQWIQDFIDDALGREGWVEDEPGHYVRDLD